MIMASQPVEISIEDRTKAEQKYGFSLYQGGVPPGRDIRVVKVAGDIEACAGTHCRNTGEVGVIKIIRVEHIQDGIERIEFAAGVAAIYYMQHLEQIVTSSSDILSVQPENLPATVTRFFTEWKEQKKEIERMSAQTGRAGDAARWSQNPSAASASLSGASTCRRRNSRAPCQLRCGKRRGCPHRRRGRDRPRRPRIR